MSNLAQRVLSALVLLPLVGLLIFWREPLGFGLLVAVAAALGVYEYLTFSLGGRGRGERLFLAALTGGMTLGLSFYPQAAPLFVPLGVVAVAMTVLSRPGEIPQAGAALGVAGFGVFYLAGLAHPLALLHRLEGPLWVCLALGLTFVNDTGAYFAGRGFGRHKLYPQVSPGKTVEGWVGGLVAATGFAFLARATFLPELTALDAILLGIPASVLGPAGDLCESLLKRAAGVKDSGRLIPGHGGVLDRVDAVLFVAPYVFVYAHFVRPLWS